ncbi:MAG: hypothetical protein ACRDVD_02145 [Acidimicrobiia bacterium]
MQGHLLEYELDPSTRGQWFWGSSFPQAACADEGDPRACFSTNHFLEEMFVRSDTRMAALSGLPIMPEGSPLSPEVMEDTRRMVDSLSGTTKGGRERLVGSWKQFGAGPGRGGVSPLFTASSCVPTP